MNNRHNADSQFDLIRPFNISQLEAFLNIYQLYSIESFTEGMN